jgi:two-component system phosphate regulon response regulator OmpR
MSEGAQIIVVDDEAELRAMVAEYLTGQGFEVRAAASGAELDLRLAERPADLVILDVHMPGEDGLSIARRLRALSNVPILMLTAASDIVDRVLGLEMGADDYLTKPFDLRELRARVRTLLRRAAPAAAPPAPAAPDPDRYVQFGRVRLDLEGRQLIDGDNRAQRLTAMEFDLLEVFARHPDRPLSRDRLLSLAHNRDWDVFDRSIDIRVARLRRKVEPDPAKPTVIKTVHGVGYVFVTRP